MQHRASGDIQTCSMVYTPIWTGQIQYIHQRFADLSLTNPFTRLRYRNSAASTVSGLATGVAVVALAALGGFPGLAAAEAPAWVGPTKLVLDPTLLYFEFAFVARIVLSWYPKVRGGAEVVLSFCVTAATLNVSGFRKQMSRVYACKRRLLGNMVCVNCTGSM